MIENIIQKESGPDQATAAILEKFSRSSVVYYSVTDQVTGIIREMILKGELHPGERLNEVQLSEALKISRSPIREGIQRLANEGLVVLVHRKGAYIKKLTAKEVRDLFEVRMALEMKVTYLAAERASESQLDNIGSFLNRTESAINSKVYNRYPLDFDFHLQIASLAQNSYLEEKVQEINAKLMLVRYLSGAETGRAWEAFEEHKEVFKGIKNGDPQSASMAMEKHLVKGRDAILKILDGKAHS